jgi:hypothetical protein
MARSDQLSRQRQKQVERTVARLRDAMLREPLLLRLPTVRELSRLFNTPVRVIRCALEELIEDGWVEANKAGHRVTRKPGTFGQSIQEVTLVGGLRSAGSLFFEFVRSGISDRSRELRVSFRTRWLRPGLPDCQFEAMAEETPGRHVGWILMNLPGADLLRQWTLDWRRVVLVDDVHPEVPLPCVVLDLAEAIRLAADHLRSLGHRRISAISVNARRTRDMWVAAGFDPDEIASATDVDEVVGAGYCPKRS